MSTTEIAPSGLQKIDVKIPLDAPGDTQWDVLLGVFGRWRTEPDQEILDVADYLHVPKGPGCVLVGQIWHFGVEFASGRPSLHYSNRRDLEGELDGRFTEVFRRALGKSQRLLGEPEVPETVRPVLSEIEVIVNDRVLLPNTPENDEHARPALANVLDRLYGEGAWEAEREPDPDRRLAWTVRARGAEGLTLEGLLEKF